MSDIVAKLVMDIQDWVEPIQDAKAHLADITGLTKKSVDSIRQSFNALAQAKSFVASRLQKVDSGESPYRILLGTVRELNQAWTNDTVAASQKAVSSQQTVAAANGHLKRTTDQAKTSVTDMAGSITSKTVLAYLAWKVAGEDALESSKKHLAVNSDFRKSLGGLYDAVTGLASEVGGTLISGLKASFNALLQFGTGFQSTGDMVDYSAKAITSWANFGSKAIKQLKSDFREASLIFSTAFVILQEGDAGGEKFYENGLALQKMAEESDKVIAKQEQMRSVLDYVKSSAERAGQSQAQSAEIAKIGTIDNLQALEAAEQAFKVRIRDTNKATSETKEWKTAVDQMTAAFARQRVAIETGTVKKQENPVDKQIKEAQQALQRLAMGETEVAIATAVANGATAEQVNTLRAALTAKRELTLANEAQAAAERAAAEAASQAAQRFQTGKERIESLRDQIDLLNGTASQADIVMRELFRQGFDTDQIAEIGQLTAELEKLEALKGKESRGGRTAQNEAALEGTSKAAELVIGGKSSNPNKKTEQLLEQIRALQQRIADMGPPSVEVEEI